jgi:hypothetical protein
MKERKTQKRKINWNTGKDIFWDKHFRVYFFVFWSASKKNYNFEINVKNVFLKCFRISAELWTSSNIKMSWRNEKKNTSPIFKQFANKTPLY